MFERSRKKLARVIAPPPEPEEDATRVANHPVISLSNLYKRAEARGFNDGLLGKEIAANPYDSRANAARTPFMRGAVNWWKVGWRRGHERFLAARIRDPHAVKPGD